MLRWVVNVHADLLEKHGMSLQNKYNVVFGPPQPNSEYPDHSQEELIEIGLVGVYRRNKNVVVLEECD